MFIDPEYESFASFVHEKYFFPVSLSYSGLCWSHHSIICPHASITLSWLLELYSPSQSQEIEFSDLVLRLQHRVNFALLGPLHFHIHFRINLLVSTKSLAGI